MDKSVKASARRTTAMGIMLVTIAALAFVAADSGAAGPSAAGWFLLILQLTGLVVLTIGLVTTPIQGVGRRDRYMGGVAIVLFVAVLLAGRLRLGATAGERLSAVLGKVLALAVLAAIYLAAVALLSRDRTAWMSSAVAVVCGLFLALRTDLGARLLAVFLFDGFLFYPFLLIAILLTFAAARALVWLATGSPGARGRPTA